jgi:hypothetical protein
MQFGIYTYGQRRFMRFIVATSAELRHPTMLSSYSKQTAYIGCLYALSVRCRHCHKWVTAKAWTPVDRFGFYCSVRKESACSPIGFEQMGWACCKLKKRRPEWGVSGKAVEIAELILRRNWLLPFEQE